MLGPEHIGEMDIYLPRLIAEEHALTRTEKDGCVYDNEWPLAIQPKWTNRRIVAQQGMFTIHGRDPRPLTELIASKGKKVGDHIAKINLTGFKKKLVYSELAMLGIRRSAIFPDLDNFVKELRGQGWQ